MQSMTDPKGANKKIAIFGGAFNPIHKGHLTLAEYYLDTLKLDTVYFVPTANPPHRSKIDFAPSADRMKMLSLSVCDNSQFKISDCEFHREDKSYTYLTVREFKKEFQNAKLFLIVGADQFLHFDKWVKGAEILNNVTLCTAARNGDDEYKSLISARDTMSIFEGKDIFIAHYPSVVISSHQIRDMIKNNIDVSDYLNEDVIEYIKEKGLYNV